MRDDGWVDVASSLCIRVKYCLLGGYGVWCCSFEADFGHEDELIMVPRTFVLPQQCALTCPTWVRQSLIDGDNNAVCTATTQPRFT